MDQTSIEAAENRLDHAESKLRQVTRMRPRDTNQNPSNVITNCQRTIEHCAKAIFIMMEVNEPSEHVIQVGSTEANNLLNAVYADLDEEHTKLVARILFLIETYNSSYPISEYGINLGQIRFEASDFLDSMEGDQCYNHAVEVVKITREILDTARVRNGLPEKSRDDVINSAYDNL